MHLSPSECDRSTDTFKISNNILLLIIGILDVISTSLPLHPINLVQCECCYIYQFYAFIDLEVPFVYISPNCVCPVALACCAACTCPTNITSHF